MLPALAFYPYVEYTSERYIYYTIMNFLILKTIIESTIQNYNHQNPNARIGDNNVFLANVTDRGVDLLIRWIPGNKEVHVRAEVNFMNGPLPTNFSIAGGGLPQVTGTINDQDVVQVRDALKERATVSDLFGDAA